MQEKLQAEINQLQNTVDTQKDTIKEQSKKISDFEDDNFENESKINTLEATEKKHKELVRQLEFQVEELTEQLEAADEARKKLRNEL